MPTRQYNIATKRAYLAADKDDGYRILVDRLWPRGLKKEAAHLDLWLKDIAPRPALRIWFGHKPERFGEFAQRYDMELAQRPTEITQLRELAAKHRVTLVYAAKDEHCNHAIVLKAFLTDRDK